jgi:hypothetical protein
MGKEKDKNRGSPVANITLVVPDLQVPRVQAAICSRYGWTAASGLTQTAFVKKVLSDFLKAEVKAHESAQAGATAAQTAAAAVDLELIIT